MCRGALREIAAVSCSHVPNRLGAGWIVVWDDGQAEPSMGWGMDGVWVVHGCEVV